MTVSIFEISLLVLAGAFISIGAGMFKDWLKYIIPKSFAYWGAALFLTGAIISITINYNRKQNSTIAKENTTISTPTNKKPTILVFCDITPSMDSKAIERLINISVEIIKKYNDADIYFYPVSSNLYTPELLHVKPNFSPYQEREYVQQIQKEISNKHSSIENMKEESCVTKSFVLAYNKFSELKITPSNKSFVVFISDMMEYCNYELGLINLSNRSTLSSNYEILDKIKPGFNLAKLGTEVTIVMNVSKKLPLDEKAHLDFWRHAFSNIGFVDSLFSRVTFTTGVPSLSLE